MKLVTLLWEVGKPETGEVVIGETLFKRLVPIPVNDDFFDSFVVPAYPYRFDVREAVVTDVFDQREYSDDLSTGDITAIIPQYRTLDLTKQAVGSLKAAYPDLALIVIDDGSNDASTEYVKSLSGLYPSVRGVILRENIGNGPALHLGITMVNTKRFFSMDSDVIVHRGGFLELMETRMIEARLYAIGVMYVRDWSHGLLYLSGVASLYDTATYFTLPPFVHAPDPMLDNMKEAQRLGVPVEAFPIFDYVSHLEAGTRRWFGNRWDLTGG
jgi:hypothetical protein